MTKPTDADYRAAMANMMAFGWEKLTANDKAVLDYFYP